MNTTTRLRLAIRGALQEHSRDLASCVLSLDRPSPEVSEKQLDRTASHVYDSVIEALFFTPDRV